MRTNVTAMVARVLAVGVVAGAFVLAAPAKAQQGYRGYPNGGDGWRGAHARQGDHDGYRRPVGGDGFRPRASFDRHPDWGRRYENRRFDHGYDHDRGHGYR
jgi:hypothetical protein